MGKKIRFISDVICRKTDDGSYHLVGGICKKCGHKMYPAISFCTECLSKNLEDYELGTEGELYSWTITRMVPPYGHFKAPHPIGLLDIKEDQARITAPMYMDESEKFHCGAKAKVVFDTYWEDEEEIVVGPKIKMVKEEEA